MTDIYGPPPSPAQVIVSAPLSAWLISLGIGLGLTYLGSTSRFNRQIRLSVLTLGLCILFTAPVFGLPENIMWGAYPTIDKQASLMFYSNNAHWLPLNSSSALMEHYPLLLIGIHICHMWVTEIFDLIVSTSQAINLHALTNLWLTVLFSTLFIRAKLGTNDWSSIIGGLCFGLSLHQFREIQWYTIEKSGIYWVPLFMWQLELILKGGRIRYLPMICFGGALYNLYTTVIMAIYGLIHAFVSRNKAVWKAVALCGFVGALMGATQYVLMNNGPSIATPDEFQLRASLDILELWPPLWNRLELWHVCSPIMVMMIPVAFIKNKVMVQDLILFALFFLLSLGPNLFGSLSNPVYAFFQFLPGLWRMAKPETYFLLPFILLCLWTSAGINEFKWKKYHKLLLAVFALLWILTTRLHPVYPQFTEYKPGVLDPNWMENVFELESIE